MTKVIVLNGSLRMEKSHSAKILFPFLEARQAGFQLVKEGKIAKDLLSIIAQPLISSERFLSENR
jgi:hypothetical protein